jgi:hypothetical protein
VRVAISISGADITRVVQGYELVWNYAFSVTAPAAGR